MINNLKESFHEQYDEKGSTWKKYILLLVVLNHVRMSVARQKPMTEKGTNMSRTTVWQNRPVAHSKALTTGKLTNLA